MLHYSQNKVSRYKGSNISIGKVILDVVGFIGKHFRPEMLSFFRRITEMGIGKLYTEEESCHFIWSLSETVYIGYFFEFSLFLNICLHLYLFMNTSFLKKL